MPVRPRKLHGLFAEPIITRSGFAGAAVYFLGEDEQIYTVSDVLPGDAQHARDAYLGGIEIGPLIQPAKQLARGLYLGTDLTASLDGRLGRGKIQRHWLIRAQASAVVLSAVNSQPERVHPLGSLKRRWIATMLSGMTSQRMSNTNTLAAEMATPNRIGFATAAALLDSLSRSHSNRGAGDLETYLATAIYLRTCSCELAKFRATLINS